MEELKISATGAAPAEAWASRRSFGGGGEVKRRDKYGRIIETEERAKSVPERAPAFPDHERLDGDKGLLKKILKRAPASSKGTPPAGATVTIHYVGYLPDMQKMQEAATGRGGAELLSGRFPAGPKFISTREHVALATEEISVVSQQIHRKTASGPHTFKLGDKSVLAAWDMCVATMRVGETCELVASPQHAYGENGAPHYGIPKGVPIIFEIELLSWKESVEQREGMSAAERLSKATLLKKEGTEAFKRAQARLELQREASMAGTDFARALELYDNATYYLADGFFGGAVVESATSLNGALPGDLEEKLAHYEKPLFADAEEEAKALVISCLLNAAQMALKCEEWRECETRCAKVLQLDAKSVKALFRRGVARTQLADYADARADLRKACELDPKSKEIRAAFDECKKAEADAHAARKAFYANTRVTEGGYEAPPPEAPDDGGHTYY